MKDITLCTVAYNAYYAGALMWESYLRFHDRVPLFAWDNGSTDGAREYFQERADRFMEGNRVEHGKALDALCAKVKTKYTLVVDTDIEFLCNLYADWKIDDSFAFGFKRYDWSKDGIIWQKGLHPCCAIFNTSKLQKILGHFSFSAYLNSAGGKFYDTGAMISFVAEMSGEHIVTPPDWETKFIHYNSVTNLIWGDACNKYPEEAKYKKEIVYQEIQKRLNQLRRGSVLAL